MEYKPVNAFSPGQRILYGGPVAWRKKSRCPVEALVIETENSNTLIGRVGSSIQVLASGEDTLKEVEGIYIDHKLQGEIKVYESGPVYENYQTLLEG